MLEVAVVGIDGAGKTTDVKRAISYFREQGMRVVRIHVPDFELLPRGFRTLGKQITSWWRWADERHYKSLVVLLLIVAAFLFYAARRSVRGAGTVLIEHHPRIDLPAFAHLYGGPILGRIAQVIARLWRPPDMAIMLEVPPEIALERIRARGSLVQSHETDEQLFRLAVLLRASVVRAVPECYFLKEPTPETFVAFLSLHLQKEA